MSQLKINVASLSTVLERAKSSILPNGNLREFFLWRGKICFFKTGIPGGPDAK